MYSVKWDVVARRARVFVDVAKKEILIFSSQTWQDLPIQGSPQPKPEGWKFKLDSLRYGKSIARHKWRRRIGRSHMTANAEIAAKNIYRKGTDRV